MLFVQILDFELDTKARTLVASQALLHNMESATYEQEYFNPSLATASEVLQSSIKVCVIYWRQLVKNDFQKIRSRID